MTTPIRWTVTALTVTGLSILAYLLTTPASVECIHEGTHYTPGVGTNRASSGAKFCAPLKIEGQVLPFPLIIASDVEGTVKRIEPDGRIAWEYADTERPRSLYRLSEDRAEFVSGRYRIIINIETGRVLESRRTDVRFRCVAADIACEKDGIRVLSIGKKIPATHPRDAIRTGSTVFVSDTFGHRVFAYDLDAEKITFEQEVYYPNQIQLVDDNKALLVVAEHENRILKIDLFTSKRTIVAGCPFLPYSDPYLTPKQLMAAEETKSLARPDSKGICFGSIYSPNGVSANPDGSYLVSDTDDHRVLWLDGDGKILSAIGPLNSPVRALFLSPWRKD